MTGPALPSRRASRWRLGLFAAGDFAFNLYWQSVMLYLLFYYTEAIELPLAVASICYAAASVWDGIVSLAVGVLADRYHRPDQFRRALTLGAVPLGLCFVFAYLPPPMAGTGALVWVVGGHLLFRTAYALVNVPYLAMSARISLDSGDRALVAGARMFCGTVAAVVVALGTVPMGRWLTGGAGPTGYAASAAVFAVIASLLLLVVGATYRDGAVPAAASSGSAGRALALAFRNRAFLTLSAAVMAMIVAVTVLDKSVLYYFKYALDDEKAGQLALGWMMAVSGAAIPLWMLVSRWVGSRGTWFAGIGACIACLLVFVLDDLRQPFSVQLYLVAIQGATVGLHYAFWALLPDTVEWGQRQFGVRSEAVLYGMAALMQRIAIGVGTLLLGFGLGREDMHYSAASHGGYRLVLALIPLGFLILAGLMMLANPLRRGSHDRIVAELTGE